VITRPSTPQLVELVRQELVAVVAPQVTDPAARIALDMALHILSTVANRCAGEIGWMQQERERIEAFAARLIDSGLDDGRIATALAAMHAADQNDLTLEGASRRYDSAAELLSCCAEISYESGRAELIETTRAIFDERLANETAITGVFEAVGRA
jgi:hypothetical protein